MKVKNFLIDQIINTRTGPIKIISYEGLINYIDNNGNINEAQLYSVLYNNEIFYASDIRLSFKIYKK